jgi:hypothetical protein
MNAASPPGVIKFEPVARPQPRLAELRRFSDGQGTDSPESWDAQQDSDASANSTDRLNLSVRSARFRDLPGLARMSDVYRLNQPEISLRGYSVTRDALRAVAPGRRSRPRVFVACVEDKIVGFVQFQATLSDRRWHAIALGTATGVYDAGPVEDILLRHAITAAGLRGVKRLYARIESVTDLVNNFGRVGFAPYATETIFAADTIVNRGQVLPVRRQSNTDTWAIHQLYNATAPRQVQYAEALTSHRWDLSGYDELAQSARRTGWLVDDGHAVAAYGRVTGGKCAHMIELLYQQDRTDILGGLIETLLNQVRATMGMGRIYCVLRGYQVEAAKELESRGFEPILEQDLLVKYTTATARAPQTEPLALHAEVIERLPKRVPSFLHQAPRDETAGRP